MNNCQNCGHPWWQHKWDGTIGRPSRCHAVEARGMTLATCNCAAQRMVTVYDAEDEHPPVRVPADEVPAEARLVETHIGAPSPKETL